MPRFSVLGTTYTNGTTEKFDWRDAVLDAGVLSGVTFFTTLAGAGAAGVGPEKMIISAAISACVTFFTIVAMKRNLIKEK
jgi:hypothetical protein